MEGIAVKDIYISLVFDTHPLEGLLQYTIGSNNSVERYSSIRAARIFLIKSVFIKPGTMTFIRIQKAQN